MTSTKIRLASRATGPHRNQRAAPASVSERCEKTAVVAAASADVQSARRKGDEPAEVDRRAVPECLGTDGVHIDATSSSVSGHEEPITDHIGVGANQNTLSPRARSGWNFPSSTSVADTDGMLEKRRE